MARLQQNDFPIMHDLLKSALRWVKVYVRKVDLTAAAQD
jgi:hypothetical protein